MDDVRDRRNFGKFLQEFVDVAQRVGDGIEDPGKAENCRYEL